MEITNVFKDLLEGMDKLEQTQKIVKNFKAENRSEEVDKMENYLKKLKIYYKWEELTSEFENLNKEDLGKFFELIKTAIETKLIYDTFEEELKNDLDSAEAHVTDVQKARNNMAKKAVEFLGI